jgi:hypothetical protein
MAREALSVPVHGERTTDSYAHAQQSFARRVFDGSSPGESDEGQFYISRVPCLCAMLIFPCTHQRFFGLLAARSSRSWSRLSPSFDAANRVISGRSVPNGRPNTTSAIAVAMARPANSCASDDPLPLRSGRSWPAQRLVVLEAYIRPHPKPNRKSCWRDQLIFRGIRRRPSSLCAIAPRSSPRRRRRRLSCELFRSTCAVLYTNRLAGFRLVQRDGLVRIQHADGVGSFEKYASAP